MLIFFENIFKNIERERAVPKRRYKEEVTALSEEEAKLGLFLEELGIQEKEKAVSCLHENKMHELGQRFQMSITPWIDEAIERYKTGKLYSFDTSYLERGIQHENHNIRWQSAIVLLFVLEQKMQARSCSYKQCLVYKKQLGRVCSELLRMSSNRDMVYAQWGLILYEIVMKKAVDEDNASYSKVFHEAYSKFNSIKNPISETVVYEGYSIAESAEELDLIYVASKEKFSDPEKEIRNLLQRKGNVNREIIRIYRTKILEKAVVQMAEEGFPIEEYRSEIEKKADTFSRDVNHFFAKYDATISYKKKMQYTKVATSYIAAKRYLDYIPKKYRKMDMTAFLKSYTPFLLEKTWEEISETYSLVKCDVLIENATKKFIDSFMKELERTYELIARNNAKNSYQQKILGKLLGIYKVPEGAPQSMSVEEYKKNLESYCLDEDIIEEICDEALINKWTDEVPDKAVSKYFKRAVAECKQKLFAGKRKVVSVEDEDIILFPTKERGAQVIKRAVSVKPETSRVKELMMKDYKMPIVALIVFSILGMNVVLFEQTNIICLIIGAPIAIYLAKEYGGSFVEEGKKIVVRKSYLMCHGIIQIGLTAFWTLLTACLVRDFSGLLPGMVINVINCVIYVLSLIFWTAKGRKAN